MKKIKVIFIGLAASLIASTVVFAQEQAILIPLSTKIQTERVLEHPAVNHVSFIGKGEYILSASTEPEKRKIIWEAKTGRKLFDIKNYEISINNETMRFLTYNNYNNSDSAIGIYDLNTGNKIRMLQGTNPKGYSSPYFFEKGKYVEFTADKTRYLWDMDTGKMVINQTCLNDYPRFWIYETPKGNIFISYCKDFDEVVLRNTKNWEKIGTYKGHVGGVSDSWLSKDGKFLSTGGNKDGKAILWDVESQNKIHTFEGHSGRVYGSLFEKQNVFLTMGYDDKKMILWDVKTGNEILNVSCQKDLPEFAFIDKSPYLPSNCKGDQENIDIYDLKKGSKIKTLSGHTMPISSFVGYLKTDSPRLLSIAKKELILWDLTTFRQLLFLKATNDYKGFIYFWAPDLKTFATYLGDNEISYWNAETG